MSDTSNPFAQGFFFAGSDPATLKMREKIALAQMMQKKKVPTNLGEGIYSVGQDIGDALAARSLMAAEKEAQASAAKLGMSTEPDATTSLAPAPPIMPPAGAQSSVTAAPIAPPTTPERPLATPAVPLPPDQQQSSAPGAPFRTPTAEALQDWRNQNPMQRGLPPVPGAAPVAAPPPAPTAARPSVADFGQKPVLAPTPPPAASPPVVAQEPDPASSEDPRRAVALTMLRQQMAKPPAPAPAPPPAPVPDQGIKTAPSPTQTAQGRPASVPGYVTPEPGVPAVAPIIRPTRREMELTAVLNANQGNPYAARSPAANELDRLVKERELRQTEQNELFKERAKQQTELIKLRETGLMDQSKREVDVAKARQELIDYGQPSAPGASDPRLLGTNRSPQRTGIPTLEPVPPGAIPGDWSKDQAKKISATQDAYDATKPELSETLSLLENIRTHAGKSRSIGPLGGLGSKTAEGQGFTALNEQLKGKNLAAIYQKIKGTGPVGEREGENLAKAQSALTTAGTEKAYDTALDTLETTLRGAVERTERKLNRPVTAYQKTPDDPYAPDIGQIGTRSGKQVEYIGGDPAKDSSYRTPRR